MAEIFLYDPIEPGSAKAFAAELKKVGNRPLSLRVHNGGGDALEGLAMYNAVKRHPAKVVVHIDGLAASIASVIAMAGDEIRIAANAYIMIHDPSGFVSGTHKDMRKMEETLQRVGKTIRAAYGRTKQSDDVIGEWMAAETWFNAEEALAAGLVDAIDEPMQMAASLDLSKFTNVPPAIAARLGRGPAAQTSTKGKSSMDETTERPDATADIAAIRGAYRSASTLGLPANVVDDWLDQGVAASALPERLIQLNAERLAAQSPKGGYIPSGAGLTSDGDGDLVDAMVAKFGGRSCSNRFGRCSFTEIGRELASSRGFNAWGATAEELFSWKNTAPRFANAGMATTSDFPTLTTVSAQKYLLEQHELNQSVLLRLARRRDRRDFKTFYNLRLSEAPALARVMESGEVTYASFAEQGETGNLESFGRIVAPAKPQAPVAGPSGRAHAAASSVPWWAASGRRRRSTPRVSQSR